VQRDVRHLRAKLHERNAEIALIVGQAGERSRDRRRHDRLHAEVGGADHVVDVADRRRIRGDDVDVHAETVGVKADRVLHTLDPSMV
jgi:hypothetical protein